MDNSTDISFENANLI